MASGYETTFLSSFNYFWVSGKKLAVAILNEDQLDFSLDSLGSSKQRLPFKNGIFGKNILHSPPN
jgi:hypothetical protein